MRNDKSIQLGEIVRREIWQVQRKSKSTSSANALNVRKAAIFLLSIQWIHCCILPLNATMSCTVDTSKYILPFLCMEMFSWFKLIKNHLRIANWQTACCRWIFQQSYDSFRNAPVSLRGPLSPASTTTIIFLARLTPVKISLHMQSGQELAKRYLGHLVYHHLTAYHRTPLLSTFQERCYYGACANQQHLSS